MSKFNTPRTPESVSNKENGSSFLFTDPRFKLYMAIGSNLIENQYYRTSNESLEELREHIRNVSPEFAAKLAVYARRNMNLRSAPLALIVELARVTSGNSIVSKGVEGVIRRADELSEAISYYQYVNGTTSVGKLPKQLSKGIARAFNKFDLYQFSKYKGSNKSVSLRDALFLTHPKPLTADKATAFGMIANDTLPPAVTWESTHSVVGQEVKKETAEVKEAASRGAWEALIAGQKMGYMATLRNLRNFLDSDVSMESINKVDAFIRNQKAINSSQQFPWRFYTAARELETGELGWNDSKAQILYNSVINASVQSLSNMTMFPQDEALLSVADVSGSMRNKSLSAMGTITAAEVARFYGRMLSHCNPNSKYVEFATKTNFNASRNPFEKIDSTTTGLGYGTDAHNVISEILKRKESFDSKVIFTDNQFWNSEKSRPLSNLSVSNQFNELVNKYRKEVNSNMKLYLIALADYNKGAPVVLNDKNFVVSGFTNDTFKTINNIHRSGDIIREIEAMEL